LPAVAAVEGARPPPRLTRRSAGAQPRWPLLIGSRYSFGCAARVGCSDLFGRFIS